MAKCDRFSGFRSFYEASWGPGFCHRGCWSCCWLLYSLSQQVYSLLDACKQGRIELETVPAFVAMTSPSCSWQAKKLLARTAQAFALADLGQGFVFRLLCNPMGLLDITELHVGGCQACSLVHTGVARLPPVVVCYDELRNCTFGCESRLACPVPERYSPVDR